MTTSVSWLLFHFWGCPSRAHLYVACWSICNWDQDFWSAKRVLDRLIWGPWSLDFFMGQRSNCSHMFLILDFCSSEVPLIPWSALKKCFDRLIPFWSRSQTLLQGTSDYPLSIIHCCRLWLLMISIQTEIAYTASLVMPTLCLGTVILNCIGLYIPFNKHTSPSEER